MTLKDKILVFLYDQVEKGKITHIKKGMVEDVEKFVTSILADHEAHKSADRMKAASEEPVDE